MAGVKGKSGPKRKRESAREPILLEHLTGGEDALAFLAAVRCDPKAPAELRLRAAVSEAQYTHVRTRDGGKNLTKGDKAKEAARGRLAPGAQPLRVVKNDGG